MANDSLVTYLNDHLSGSIAALQLLDHLVDTASLDDRPFFTTLRADIAEDRQVLADIISRVGGRPSGIRHLGGWIAEKASRLKLILDDGGSRGGFKLFESLELLLIGIHGKQALWRAMAVIAPSIPELHGIGFARLEARAQSQHAHVEARRLAVAPLALATRVEARA